MSTREYLVYALIETHFVKTDPRFRSLPPLARWVYMCIWVDAWHTRREQLPYWYDTRAIHDTSGVDTRSVKKHVATLQQKGLISISKDGRITVCGIKGKGNIKWKDDDQNLGQDLDQDLTRQGGVYRVGVGEGEGVNTPLPPKGEVVYPDWFSQLWAVYPRKIGKPACWRALKRLGTSDLQREMLAAAAKHYAAHCQSKDSRYVKHPATFFGPDRWWEEWVNGVPDSELSESDKLIREVNRRLAEPKAAAQ